MPDENPMMSPQDAGIDARKAHRLIGLDVMRGLAATMIFVFHFYCLYPNVKGVHIDSMGGIPIKIYFPLGVPLFYALSGISLYLGYFGKRQKPGFVRNFLIRRFFRIAPLFYTALIAWGAIFISRGWCPSLRYWVSNVTFLFNLFPDLHESLVGAGWSIGVEMIFYFLFPSIVTCVCRLWSAAVFCALAGLVALMGYEQILKALPTSTYAGLAFISHIHYFAFGICAYFLMQKVADSQFAHRPRPIAAILAAIFAVELYVMVSGLMTPLLVAIPAAGRVLWGIPIATLILLVTQIPWPQRATALFVKLGERSFSLYLLHPLVLYFAFQHVTNHRKLIGKAPASFFEYMVICFIILVVLSTITYRWIELPFIRLSRRLTTSRPSSSASQTPASIAAPADAIPGAEGLRLSAET